MEHEYDYLLTVENHITFEQKFKRMTIAHPVKPQFSGFQPFDEDAENEGRKWAQELGGAWEFFAAGRCRTTMKIAARG